MKRRILIHTLALTAGALATGSLAALAPAPPPSTAGEEELIRRFRQQVAGYPGMTPQLLRAMTRPTCVLERADGKLKFLNAGGEIIALSLHGKQLRAILHAST